ncbi:craniofacial development protein 2-like [Teleopsis dalmanni]|uniref:craniofacial development protein 2-like n=1 Tax=Teleopsis dalmanni TaxID=139649 RepID=UPI0018CF5916|nr:craniofacial development protein 2-like [Teleopsis dalmanni]
MILEMKKHNIDILGVSETWWPDCGEFFSQNTKVYYSGNQNKHHRNGVGILMIKDITKFVTEFIPKSDRAMMVKINAKPLNINIIQVYAPTADKSDDEIKSFYAELNELMRLTKSHEINIIQGDFNAKVGKGEVNGVVGQYGLGERNDTGDRLIQFCQEYKLKTSNTMFNLPPRRLYAWKSTSETPDNIIRNQIDFILINYRFCSSSDHNLLMAKICIRLASNRKKKPSLKLNLEELRNDDIKCSLKNKINHNISSIDSRNPNNIWEQLKTTITSSSKEIYGSYRKEIKNHWMSEDIEKLINERR